MANHEEYLVAILERGVEEWNEWRERNTDVVPDLREADLHEADLHGFDLSRTNLSRADLSDANLSGANLSGADLNKADCSNADFSNAQLNGAKLSGARLIGTNFEGANLYECRLEEAYLFTAKLQRANLSKADLDKAVLFDSNLTKANLTGAILNGANLSGADLTKAQLFKSHLHKTILDENTRFQHAKGVVIGVNGFLSKKTNSTALMTHTPPADSMQGPNPDAVVESLKRARKLHNYSLRFAVAVIAFDVLNPLPATLTIFESIKITTWGFANLALLFSAAVLVLVTNFMADALSGARYLQDRASAMQVSKYPWSLSRYAGSHWGKRALSLLTRLVLAFHPIAYLLGFPQNYPPEWYHVALGIWTLGFSIWIFILSQQFQRPILFDLRTEQERRSDVDKLAITLDKNLSILVDRLDEVIDRLGKR